MGIVGIGLPILALCEEKDLSLTDEMALAILIFPPNKLWWGVSVPHKIAL